MNLTALLSATQSHRRLIWTDQTFTDYFQPSWCKRQRSSISSFLSSEISQYVGYLRATPLHQTPSKHSCTTQPPRLSPFSCTQVLLSNHSGRMFCLTQPTYCKRRFSSSRNKWQLLHVQKIKSIHLTMSTRVCACAVRISQQLIQVCNLFRHRNIP